MDDLDDDMELPDDELAGESPMGDLGDEVVVTDVDAELDILIVEPVARLSGGARSASPATPRKAAKRPAPKAAKAAPKAASKKAVKKAPKKAAKSRPRPAILSDFLSQKSFEALSQADRKMVRKTMPVDDASGVSGALAARTDGAIPASM